MTVYSPRTPFLVQMTMLGVVYHSDSPKWPISPTAHSFHIPSTNTFSGSSRINTDSKNGRSQCHRNKLAPPAPHSLSLSRIIALCHSVKIIIKIHPRPDQQVHVVTGPQLSRVFEYPDFFLLSKIFHEY